MLFLRITNTSIRIIFVQLERYTLEAADFFIVAIVLDKTLMYIEYTICETVKISSEAH